MRIKIPSLIIGAVALLGLASCSGQTPTAHTATPTHTATPSPTVLPNVPRAVVGKPLTYQAELPNAMAAPHGRPMQITISKTAQADTAGGYQPKRGRIYGFVATVKNVSKGQAMDVASWYWLGQDGNRVDLSTDFVAPNPFGSSKPVATSLGLSGEDLGAMGGGSQLGPDQHTTGYELFDVPATAGVLVHATYDGKALFAVDVGAYTAASKTKARPSVPELTIGHAVTVKATTETGPTKMRVQWLSTRNVASYNDGIETHHPGKHHRWVCLKVKLTNIGTEDDGGIGDTWTAISASGEQSDPTTDADDGWCPFEPFNVTDVAVKAGAHVTTWQAFVLPKGAVTLTNSDTMGAGDLFRIKL